MGDSALVFFLFVSYRINRAVQLCYLTNLGLKLAPLFFKLIFFTEKLGFQFGDFLIMLVCKFPEETCTIAVLRLRERLIQLFHLWVFWPNTIS